MPQSPQFLLPFAEKEYVDGDRACLILGICRKTLARMAQSGLVEMIEYSLRGHYKRVRYLSIVEYCDQLRHRYSIPDRRPILSASFLRHRDEDLLPFPLSITMGSEEALAAMGLPSERHRSEVRRLALLVEEGRFEAYQLVPGGHWRISRPSFAAYLDRVRRAPLPQGRGRYKKVDMDDDLEMVADGSASKSPIMTRL